MQQGVLSAADVDVAAPECAWLLSCTSMCISAGIESEVLACLRVGAFGAAWLARAAAWLRCTCTWRGTGAVHAMTRNRRRKSSRSFKRCCCGVTGCCSSMASKCHDDAARHTVYATPGPLEQLLVHNASKAEPNCLRACTAKPQGTGLLATLLGHINSLCKSFHKPQTHMLHAQTSLGASAHHDCHAAVHTYC